MCRLCVTASIGPCQGVALWSMSWQPTAAATATATAEGKNPHPRFELGTLASKTNVLTATLMRIHEQQFFFIVHSMACR